MHPRWDSTPGQFPAALCGYKAGRRQPPPVQGAEATPQHELSGVQDPGVWGTHAGLQQQHGLGILSGVLLITCVLSKGPPRRSEGESSGQGRDQPADEAGSERTYGFAALADHPAGCGRGHSYVGFQLHLFFGVKEVFFLQFPKDPPLGLRARCD